MKEDTIAAISTPSGEGGIGVIRISGNRAIEIADLIFKGFSGKKIAEISGYTALYGGIYNDEAKIDEAVALLFRAPKSYTGEDVVELSLHGGNYVLKETLRTIFSLGARPADGGEFTRRAFSNGKLDLIEAEAVMGIISANGLKAQRSALSLLGGAASSKINIIRENLLTAAAGLAVYSDYPDDELPEFSPETLNSALEKAKTQLNELLRSYDAGKILREGVDTVIAGKPNVGKSTLMNLLAGCRRSIVTSVAGTTRDVVEDSVMLGDILLHLSDTAGLRDTNDEVEKIGVEISKEKIESAGLIIAVFDGSVPYDNQDLELIELCKDRPSVAVVNKSDLDQKFVTSVLEGIPFVVISAENSNSIDALQEVISRVCGLNQLDGNDIVLGSERQRNCCVSACRYIEEALDLLSRGYTLDTVGVCIDDAMNELLSLTGERATNAIIDEVFRKFCVGK